MQIPLDNDSLLSDLFVARVATTPDGKAYRQFRDGQWHDYTWAQAGREVARYQAALRAEGFAPGERVALCLRNRIEWMFFDQAALGLGLVVVPLYFGDRPENMAYCMNDCNARFLFIEDTAVWETLQAQVPDARAVCLNSDARSLPRIKSIKDWLPASGSALAQSLAKAHELATLVYTSGTTGRPKGVMLSHRNILSNAIASWRACSLVNDTDRFLSFLPLSHMFERTVGYYLSMYVGAETVYARGIPELAEDMANQRPTIIVCVPRIFERIYARMQEGLPAGSTKRKLFESAVAVGWRRFNHEAGFADALAWPILKTLVAKKLHARMGGRVRLIVVGSAALAPHLARTFIGLGLPILHGYGLTEFSPVVSANRLDDNAPASVGRPLEGVEIKTTPEGELCVRGPALMLGYWNNRAATEAIIDTQGWLHTGDIVRVDDDRILITGRAKEIIVMSNGEKIPPGDAEQAILMDPAFEQVMVIGEGRAHLGLIAVTKLTDTQEICRRANAQLHAFPGYVRIHHLVRTDEAWTLENGMLTPTLKAKRKVIETRYAVDIEAAYANPSLYRAA